MLNLEDLSDTSSSSPLLGLAATFDMNNNGPESQNGAAFDSKRSEAARNNFSPDTTDARLERRNSEVQSDRSTPSTKRARLEGPISSATLQRGEMRTYLKETGEIASFAEAFPFLPSHAEGAAVPCLIANGQQIYDNYANIDMYTGMPFGAPPGDFLPIQSSAPSGGSHSTHSSSSPGSRSDSGLSTDYSPNPAPQAYFGFSSPITTSSGSIVNATYYAENNPEMNSDLNFSCALNANESAYAMREDENYSVSLYNDQRKLRYLRTVEFLKKSNLFELTMKTADLLKRNHVVQKEIETLKEEVAHLLTNYGDDKSKIETR